MTDKPSLTVQIGGSHYKDCPIQPVQFIEANKLAFLEGCVIKRLLRHDKPTGKGRQDIEKAIHELQLLLEHRYPVERRHANDNSASASVSSGRFTPVPDASLHACGSSCDTGVAE